MPRSNDPWPRNRLTDAFERRVAVQLRRCLQPGEPALVACSGGPDSVAALVAVGRLLTPGRVIAAHFDHRIRPVADSEADANFVEALAADVGARVMMGRSSSPLTGDEATARAARYRWLACALVEAGATAAVTGHTRDDQAETVLLNLTRGAGLRGASGMAVAGSWPFPVASRHDLRLLRPLLALSRAEVERYLAALGVVARLDPTNEHPTYARNRVRLQAMPALETVNPEVRAQLAAFANRAREAEDALDGWALREMEAHGEFDRVEARIPRRLLSKLPPAVAKRIVAALGARLGIELNAAQRAGSVDLASRRGARLDLAGGEAWTDAEWLHVKFHESGRR